MGLQSGEGEIVHVFVHVSVTHFLDPELSIANVRLYEQLDELLSEPPGHERTLRGAFHLLQKDGEKKTEGGG